MSKEDNSTRDLAEMKAYLEKRIAELQAELSRMTSIVKVVDSALADKSFKRMEIPTQTTVMDSTERTPHTVEQETIPIVTDDGTHLGEMEITSKDLILTPSSGIEFDVNSAPFRTFLIGRILDPMVNKDSQSLEADPDSQENMISYDLQKEDDILERLSIYNYGDEKRLQELKNAIRWTLRTIHDKRGVT